MKRQPFPWKIKKNCDGLIMRIAREEAEREASISGAGDCRLDNRSSRSGN